MTGHVECGRILLEELRNNTRDGAFWQDWYCPPPPEDVLFTVTRQEWSGWRLGHPVRRIYEIKIVEKAP